MRCAARATYRVMLVTMHNSSAGGLCKKKWYRRTENVFFQKMFLFIQDSWDECLGLSPQRLQYICVHIWDCLLFFHMQYHNQLWVFLSEKKDPTSPSRTTMDALKKNCIQHILLGSVLCLMYLAINPSSIQSRMSMHMYMFKSSI